jgi:murein DD-endopeptidase MepM/ murein hydrolase activator NlpD
MSRLAIPLVGAVGIALLAGGLLAACSRSAASSEAVKPTAVTASIDDSPVAPTGPPLQAVVPLADGFDFPVGPPDAKRYYNAQAFQRNGHLGEDWNGNGGGNTDLGDPVHAVAIGVVHVAADYGAGWGNVLRVYHNIGSAGQPKLIESLYAHLDTMIVQVGDTVGRGQQIGTIGDAHGAYWAHLHLEMRHDVGRDLGGGYGDDTTGYLIPTPFIRAHRPK